MSDRVLLSLAAPPHPAIPTQTAPHSWPIGPVPLPSQQAETELRYWVGAFIIVKEILL